MERVRTTWDREKKHPVSVEVLVTHWGYTVKSSGGRIAVAALLKFGLLEEQDSSTGRQVLLTERALKAVLGEESQKRQAIKEAALTPSMYRELWNRFGPDLPSDESLRNKLLLEYSFNEAAVSGFIKDYKESVLFAGLKRGETVDTPTDNIDPSEEDEENPRPTATQTADQVPGPTPTQIPAQHYQPPPQVVSKNPHAEITPDRKVLASYTIPLGQNVAELTFTGEKLEPDDFESLAEYVRLFQKEYERKLKKEAAAKEAAQAALFPRQAIWHNKDHDMPVIIVGEMGESGGQRFYQTDGGTGISQSELEFS